MQHLSSGMSRVWKAKAGPGGGRGREQARKTRGVWISGQSNGKSSGAGGKKLTPANPPALVALHSLYLLGPHPPVWSEISPPLTPCDLEAQRV